MDVSVIVVNYNTNDLLENCIHSIFEQTKGVFFEVIIVDNNSRDFTPDKFHFTYENVRVLRLDRNLGFGKANNEGVKIASGDFVFFLNSDTVLLNDAISILCHYMREHEHVGICGGNLYTKENKPNMSYTQSFPSVSDYMKLLLSLDFASSGEESFNRTGVPMEIGGYISGADLMIRKTLLDKYGGFDPDFFMYFEDVELCYRARSNGAEIHSVPSARILHLQGASTSAKGEASRVKSQGFLLRSEFLYFRKTSCLSAVRLLWICYLLKSVMARAVYGCLRNRDKSMYWKSMIDILKDVYDKKIV